MTNVICASYVFAVAPAAAVAPNVIIGIAKLYDYCNSNDAFGKEGKLFRDSVLAALKEKRGEFEQKFRKHNDIENIVEYLKSHEELFRTRISACEFEIPNIIDAIKAGKDCAAILSDAIMDGLAELGADYRPSSSREQGDPIPYQFIRASLISGFETAIKSPENYRSIEAQVQMDMLHMLAVNLDKLDGLVGSLKGLGATLRKIEHGVEALVAGQLQQQNDAAKKDETLDLILQAALCKVGDMPVEETLKQLNKTHELDLASLPVLIDGVLKNGATPKNFAQMLSMAVEALEKVKHDNQKIWRLENEISEIKHSLGAARTALENPDFLDLAKAQASLRAARKEYDARTKRRRQQELENSAELIVLDAQMAIAQSNIDEAAALYDEAIEKVAHNKDLKSDYLFDLSSLLFETGMLSSSPKWLEMSIDRRKILAEMHQDDDDLEPWACSQNNLGNALFALGTREGELRRLEEAVAAYRLALEVYTREEFPLDWATTQNNLGNTLSELGARAGNAERIEEATLSYGLALEIRTRDELPHEWAASQNNLGNALSLLGSCAGDIGRLEEAVVAYRLALEVRIREELPFDWAETQNNLGTVLRIMGSKKDDPGYFEEAITAYRYALEVRIREEIPYQWAITQNNLAIALSEFGSCVGDVSRLEEAVTVFRRSLEVRTRDEMPYQWAITQCNLGNTLSELGSRGGGAVPLEEAITAYYLTLTIVMREEMPIDWAMTKNNLGGALKELGEMQEDARLIEQAVISYELALEIYTDEQIPFYHQQAKDNLNLAQESLATLKAKNGN